MNDQRLTLGVQLGPDSDTDEVELDQLRLRLRERLLELDVDSVESRRAGPAPAGARGLDLLAAGALLVSLSKSATTLKAVVGVVQTWMANRPVHTVELTVGGNTLKVSGVASQEQQRLIDLFIERTAGA